MRIDDPKVSVIIVTHNSQKYISKAIECLNNQTYPHLEIIIVDSASNENNYLDGLNCKIIKMKENIGFCQGNNIGYFHATGEYILFLNPDAFLTKKFIEHAIQEMILHQNCGILTGMLLGFDIDSNTPTKLFDSTGVFSTWYGRWYDRDQGKLVCKIYAPESLPAICGALMFCRKAALESIRKNDEIFDSSFYMYKEDIDLSCRMHVKGWKLMFFPHLIAYHCRGWAKSRKDVPRYYRKLSAKNELRLHLRLKNPIKISYSLLKCAAVYCFNK